MATKTTEKRLAALEVKRKAPVTIHCVAIGDGPALRPDGSTCTVHHDLMVTLGGDHWIRFVTSKHDDKDNG